ncbi:MAG: FtsX-like permease family protein [Deltaproteobacteria bacterium]|nr:FtsX-like permease family protein [Deltaproteobacteria bacterium]
MRLAELRILFLLSARSLLAHRAKTLIVGGILATGTFLLVIGTSLLANVERAMERAITGSLVGHFQVYSADAEDELAFFGPAAGSRQDIGVLKDWPRVASALRAIPGVAAVIPMGRDVVMASGRNELDAVLEDLRAAVRGGEATKTRSLVAKARHILDLMRDQWAKRAALAKDAEAEAPARALLERAASDALWAPFEAEPLPVLDFLDQNVAVLEGDATATILPYIGTDLDLFARSFRGFEIVDGQMVPPGQRGFLFNKELYEEFLKNKVAFELDRIDRARRREGKTIAGDAALTAKVKKLEKYGRRVVFEIDPARLTEVEAALRELLPEVSGDLAALIDAFLVLDDESFDRRYAFFYREIAPKMSLYRIKIGEPFTVRAFTNSGYLKSINLKIWGTFHFRGLEGSVLASRYSLMDLISYRDLYGYMTDERRKEIEELRGQLGTREIGREDAEAALFGGDAAGLEAEGRSTAVEEALKIERVDPMDSAFAPEEIQRGVVPHAAVLLEDGVDLEAARAEIEARSRADRLGLTVRSWREASGIVGQFILVMRTVLYVALIIIFGVALFIINNSMLMATLARTSEIGTMRAIGAQRGFVLWSFLMETFMLCGAAGALGSAAAAGVLGVLGRVGIPANTDVLVFLFGGPALHPQLFLASFVFAVLVVFSIAAGATYYPARIATRIAPVVAMQRRE